MKSIIVYVRYHMTMFEYKNIDGETCIKIGDGSPFENFDFFFQPIAH